MRILTPFSLHYTLVTIRDGGKPDFFQNPGSGSNPGFGLKNPGFPVPPIFYENVHFFSIIFNLALCVILKTKLSSSRTWFITYFKTLRLFLANCLNMKWEQKRISLNSHPLRELRILSTQ